MENEKQTKKCPQCQTEIPLDAKKCQHCQSDFRSWSARHKIMTGLLILMLGFVTFCVMLLSIEKDKIAPRINRNSPSNSSSLSIGDIGYLQSSSGSLLVAFNKRDQEEIIRLATIQDSLGISKMILDGWVMLIDSGIQVRVIDKDLSYMKVRIMEGKFYGEAGWVPGDSVFKNK